MSIDLAPCPFCGAQAQIRDPEPTDGWALHVSCRCGVQMFGRKRHFVDAVEAAQAWNARTIITKDSQASDQGSSLASTPDSTHAGLIDDSRRASEAAQAWLKDTGRTPEHIKQHQSDLIRFGFVSGYQVRDKQPPIAATNALIQQA